MRKALGTSLMIFGAFVAAVAFGQSFPQTLPASTVWGRLGISAGPGQAIPFSILQGNLQLTMTGDCTTASPNAITCTKTNGTAFGPLATQAIPCLVSQGCTGLTSGTSGGVPYYSSSSAITSSGALTANLPVIGGGAGAAPSVGTRTGNTTLFATSTGSLTSGNCIKADANGNLVDNGGACATASRVLLATLTASNSATLSDTTNMTATYYAYELVFENILPATNAVTCELQVQSGGSFKTSSYLTGGTHADATSVAQLSAVTAYIQITRGSSGNISNAGSGVSGAIRVSNPAQTSSPKMWIGAFGYPASSNTYGSMTVMGSWTGGNGAITGFQVLMSSGNITSGTVKIYGLT